MKVLAKRSYNKVISQLKMRVYIIFKKGTFHYISCSEMVAITLVQNKDCFNINIHFKYIHVLDDIKYN